MRAFLCLFLQVAMRIAYNRLPRVALVNLAQLVARGTLAATLAQQSQSAGSLALGWHCPRRELVVPSKSFRQGYLRNYRSTLYSSIAVV